MRILIIEFCLILTSLSIASLDIDSVKMDVIENAWQNSTHMWVARYGECFEPGMNRATQLSVYDLEGYEGLNQDDVRNKAYERGVKILVAKRKRSHGSRPTSWLEVGPGAHGTLTKMPLEADLDSSITALEGNKKSADLCTKEMASFGKKCQIIWGTVGGGPGERGYLSSYDVLLHEIIGYFGGSEGLADVLRVLKSSHPQRGVKTPTVCIPSVVATFLTLGCIDQRMLGLRPAFVAPPGFALIHRLRISEAQEATGGTGDDWLKGVCFEWIDSAPANPKNIASKGHSFNKHIFTSKTDATFNSLLTWIWVEIVPSGGEKRLPRTDFPYNSNQKNFGRRDPTRVDFSSRCDDDKAAASNWRNAVILFKESVHVKAGEQVSVDASGTDGSTYVFKVHVNGREIIDYTISNLYPTFEEFAPRHKTGRDSTLKDFSASRHSNRCNSVSVSQLQEERPTCRRRLDMEDIETDSVSSL